MYRETKSSISTAPQCKTTILRMKETLNCGVTESQKGLTGISVK